MFHTVLRTVLPDVFPRHNSSGGSAARRGLTRRPALDILESRVTPSGNYTNLAVSGAVVATSRHDVKIEFGATSGSSFTVNRGAHDVTIIGGIPAGDTVTLNGRVRDVTIANSVSGTFAMTGRGHDVRMGNVFGSVTIGSSSANRIHDFTAGVIESGATFTVNASFHDGTVASEDAGSVVFINPSHHSFNILASPVPVPVPVTPPGNHTPSGNYTNLAVSGAVVVTSPQDVNIQFSATPGSSFTVNGGAHDVTIVGGIPAGDTVTLNGLVHDVKIGGTVFGTFAMTGSGHDVRMGDVFGSVTIGSSSADSIHDFTAGVIESGATFTVNASFHDGTVASEDAGSVVFINPSHHSFNILASPPVTPSGNYTNLAVSGAVVVTSPQDVNIQFSATPGSSFTVNGGAHDVTIVGGIPAGDTVTLNGLVHDVKIGGTVFGTFAMTGSGHDVRMGDVFGSVTIGSSSADSIHDFTAGVIESGATFTVNASFHDGTVASEDAGSVVFINPSHHSFNILASPPVTPSGNYTNLAVSGAVVVTSPQDVNIQFSATPGSSFTVNGGAHDVTIVGGIPAGDTVTLNGLVHDVKIGGTVFGTFAMTGSGHDVRMGDVFGSVTIGSSSADSIHDFTAGVIESGATFTVNASFHDGTVASEDAGSVVFINPSHHSFNVG